MYTITINQTQTMEYSTLAAVMQAANEVTGTAIVMCEYGRKLLAVVRNGIISINK